MWLDLQGHQDRRVKLACQVLQAMMEKRDHVASLEKWAPLALTDCQERMDLLG